MLTGIPLDVSRELRPSLDQILMLDAPLARAGREAEVRDLDGRIAQLDAMVNAATRTWGDKKPRWHSSAAERLAPRAFVAERQLLVAERQH